MNETTLYSNMISLRSRRLRTAGIVLLVVLALLTGYGLTALMPAMKTAATLYRTEIQKAEAKKVAEPAESAKTIRRVNRLMAIKFVMMNTYWLVCGLVAFLAILVAWLDFREVARRFAEERRSLWSNTAKIPSAEELQSKP